MLMRGDTLLNIAAQDGDSAKVQKFLDEGVDANLTNHFGASPRHRAAEYGRSAVVAQFLDAGGKC